jgi:hypothetical protein
MAYAIVDEGQNLMDIALQYLGDETGLFELALINDFTLSEKIVPGQQILLPDPVNAGAVQYFAERGIVIATEQSVAAVDKREGINYWIIGQDFIVQ